MSSSTTMFRLMLALCLLMNGLAGATRPEFVKLLQGSAATSVMVGADCPTSECHAMLIDAPSTALERGGLTYDEQPAHPVLLSEFEIMQSTVSPLLYSQSGLPGTADDVSHELAQQFADWYSLKQNASCRLPTEAEWEYATGHSSLLTIGQLREHVSDWHGVYGLASLQPGGPTSGILKVVKGGNGTRVSARFTVGVSETNATANTGFRTSFRLVCSPGVPASGNSALPQIGILPSGIASTPSGERVDLAALGPAADVPLFNVRMVMPVPPDSEKEGVATLAGLEPSTMFHSHSPGLEVMPNGDVLAVWFSSAGGGQEGPSPGEPGKEASINARMVQARLRHGSDRWDMPGLFYDFKYANDQSGLLWTEDDKTWFWGGGGTNPSIPFKVAVSTDSGGTWRLHLPNITNSVAPTALASQPITTAFRGRNGGLYMGVDSEGASSGLWVSHDQGISWQDTHGRTVGRHTTFFTANGTGAAQVINAYGGKLSDIDGYMPFVQSTDGGAQFGGERKLPFPALGSNQRPCVHRLISGNLVFVGDMQVKGSGKQPKGWTLGTGVYAAISQDNGDTWRIKPLPISLPHETDQLSFGTLGYSTVRQGKNGVIHILSTMTHPCLHYQINEAWLLSDEQLSPEPTSPVASEPKQFSSQTASGGRAVWTALTEGGYALHGSFTTYRSDSSLEYNASYVHGLRATEELWAADGSLEWSWSHEQGGTNTSVFKRYSANGKLLARSLWDNKPIARDYHLIKSNPAGFRFTGLTAEGLACTYHLDGSVRSSALFVAGVPTPANTSLCTSTA